MKTTIIAIVTGLVCLLSLPEANSRAITAPRVIDVNITGWVLTATSQTEDGTISKIEVYRESTGEKVRNQFCSGYSCNVNLYGLPAGNYSAKVICQYTSYTEYFTL